MISLYETNMLNQLQEWKRILLHSHLPSALYTINSNKRRIVFVGIGSSYWAEKLANFFGESMSILIVYHCIAMILLDQNI